MCVCEYVYINVLERCMPKRVSSTEKVFAEWNWNEGELESERERVFDCSTKGFLMCGLFNIWSSLVEEGSRGNDGSKY